MTAVIRAASIRGFSHLAMRLGGDPDTLLRRHGLSPDSLDNEEALLPALAVAQLLEDSGEALHCPDFGLQLGRVQTLDVLGPLAIAIQHSATAAEGLEWASRYLFVHTAINLEVVPSVPGHPKLAEFRYEFGITQGQSIRQAVDQTLGFTHRTILSLAGGHYSLQAVSLPHTPLAPASTYRQYFGAPVHFGQPHAALFVPRGFLDTPIQSANPTLHELATSYLEANFPTRESTVSARVRLAISRSQGVMAARKEQIARVLAMHPRTLQRHLTAEGTTFEVIRDHVTRETALQYLTTTRMPLARVAALLGFSEQSALTRACKRWFNSTPTALRRGASRSGGKA